MPQLSFSLNSALPSKAALPIDGELAGRVTAYAAKHEASVVSGGQLRRSQLTRGGRWSDEG